MRTKSPEKSEIIIKFVNEYYEKYGNSPSLRDIEGGTGIPAKTVHRYLVDMRENGIIEYEGSRSIRTAETNKISDDTTLVPVVGQISCGKPKLAQENIEKYYRIPRSLTGNSKCFLIRADGASMVEAGIFPGDYVLVRQQSTAEQGQIVSALVCDETATLKRFYRERSGGRVRLHPENNLMEDQYYDAEDVQIQGVALAVYHCLE